MAVQSRIWFKTYWVWMFGLSSSWGLTRGNWKALGVLGLELYSRVLVGGMSEEWECWKLELIYGRQRKLKPLKIYIGEKWGKHDGGGFVNNFQGQEEEHSFNHVEKISKFLNHTLEDQSGKLWWGQIRMGEKVGDQLTIICRNLIGEDENCLE